jgi:parallel beta-helix repeat protein
MKNELLARSFVFGIVVLFFGASVTSAYNVEPSLSAQPMNRGNILYVGGSGPGNYTTIQEAINNATNGDTIFVYNNTYNENIDTKLKKISLIGEERDITIIKGQTTAPVVRIGSSDVTIAGFTVIGTSTEVVIQVVSLSDNVFIFNNVIKDGGYGISLLPPTSKVTITDNTIINHTFIGIQLQTSSYDVISGNRIENNGGQGIELSLSSNHNSILNNSIINNAKEAILVGGITSTENTIAGNNISNNQIGIRFTSAGSNTIKDNNIQESSMEGVLLQSSNENAIEKNNFIQNKRQAAFKLSSRNSWDANYWSNWIGFKLTQPLFQKFPKVIGGLLRLNFDWHPAKLPYNISTFA